MKVIINILFILPFTFFTTDYYYDLIGKDISSTEVKELLDKLGSDYEYDDTYDMGNFYIYEERGVELSFSKQNKLKAIFFKAEQLDSDIALPLSLKVTDTRQDVEDKLGKPDKATRTMSDYRVYYIDENIVIRYKSRDAENMNNSIKSVSVEQVKDN